MLVRSAALRTLMQVVCESLVWPPINRITRCWFLAHACEYNHPFQCIDIPRIHHPHIKHLVQGREVFARYTYAQCIVQLADTADRYLEMGHLSALLMDASSIVKRAVLYEISSLCMYLGRQKTSDVSLSHMITHFNSSRLNLTQWGPTLEASNESSAE